MEPDVNMMSVKELRTYIEKAGLTDKDCFEISDLRVRAKEATEQLATSGTAAGAASATTAQAAQSGPPKREKRKLSGYDCTLVGPADVLAGSTVPSLLVIFLHGFGATSQDFESVPGMLGLESLLPAPGVLWVFPQAPSMAMIMPAWWTIDVMQWMGSMQAGEAGLAKLIRDVPPGLPACRSKMLQLVSEVCSLAADCPSSRVVIGGFSQGAMTALDVALSLPTQGRVAGVVSVSGAPIVVDEWAGKLAHHRGLPVLISHGTADATLPFQCSGWLEEMLKHNGAKVKKVVHSDGHTIGPSHVIAAIRDFLVACAESP